MFEDLLVYVLVTFVAAMEISAAMSQTYYVNTVIVFQLMHVLDFGCVGKSGLNVESSQYCVVFADRYLSICFHFLCHACKSFHA